MEVFRIAKTAFAQQLTASGSANRWNRKNQQVIYTGSSRSLSTLELIVHKGAVVPAEKYQVMIISIADEEPLYKQVYVKSLPPNWRTFAAYATLQKIGSNWINSQESLILKVPSAIIPQEYNYIINTEHPDFPKKVQLIRTEAYFWDSRLF